MRRACARALSARVPEVATTPATLPPLQKQLEQQQHVLLALAPQSPGTAVPESSREPFVMPAAISASTARDAARPSLATPGATPAGTLQIESSGEHGQENLVNMPRANQVQQTLNRLIENDANLQTHPGLAVSWKAVDQTTWEVRLREGRGTKDAKAMRAAGEIPGVIYSQKSQTEAIAINARTLRQAVGHGMHTIFDVHIDGSRNMAQAI